MASIALPTDLIEVILSHIEGDSNALYQCSVTNKEFQQIASKILYSTVRFSPAFSPTLNLNDKGVPVSYSVLLLVLPHVSPRDRAQLVSAALAQYAPLVRTFEFSGFVSARHPPRNQVPSLVISAIQSFSNLRVLVLTPTTCYEGMFDDLLTSVREHCTNLEHLAVNSFCTDEGHVPHLVRIVGLKELRIVSPTRAVLDAIPDWLDRMETPLVGLHFTNNCGSITPGVLRSCIPHAKDLHAFSLGLSFSLTDMDVFTFLGEIHDLQFLTLQYYRQLRQPTNVPQLPHLRKLKVLAQFVQSRPDAATLSKWVRRLICHSSLESLCIEFDTTGEPESYWATLPAPAFDSLIHHFLFQSSAMTRLRVLDLGGAYLSSRILRQLFGDQGASSLEDMWIGISLGAFAIFQTPTTLTSLRTLRLTMRHTKASTLIRLRPFTSQFTPPSLRRLTINGASWDSSLPSSYSTSDTIPLPKEIDAN